MIMINKAERKTKDCLPVCLPTWLAVVCFRGGALEGLLKPEVNFRELFFKYPTKKIPPEGGGISLVGFGWE